MAAVQSPKSCEAPFLLQLKPVLLVLQKCFRGSVGGHNLECLINPAINKSREATIGVTKLQSKAMHLASLRKQMGGEATHGEEHQNAEQKPRYQDGLVG